ncbi:hypothetical protein DBZ36_05015 [Alginatibacterium sediminis]|uniref:Transcriptional regulatory protein TyrR n=1 Tax=Alginatibacterium sediminis TaxID=2164068 RepID=A0A420EGI5_9ALTE|nr:TyrR/PhhR family helix-turn-helix DNA-binding protein [Alginatibacterium sediminis]RKF19822.1 hypothetical protein DBZ36_05015 [Alginatibacterium sediminis]
MRLELVCEQNTQLFSAVLALLVKHQIELSAMESSSPGRLFLSTEEVALETLQALLSELRRIAGVSDARIVHALPSEIEQREVQILLDSVPYPVVLIDKNGMIRQHNQAFEDASNDELLISNANDISKYLKGFSPSRWFGSGLGKREISEVQLSGRSYMVEVIPLSESEESADRLPGAIMLFKSTFWLEDNYDLEVLHSELEQGHIVSQSSNMNHILHKLHQLVEEPKATLLFGEAGVGKRFLAQLLNQLSIAQEDKLLIVDCRNSSETFVEQLVDIVSQRPFTVALQYIEVLSIEQLREAYRVFHDPIQGIGQLLYISHFSPEQLSALWGSDGYYDVVQQSLAVEPLRKRREDIAPLAQLCLDKYYLNQNASIPVLSKEVKRYLSSQTWPGNISQLFHVIQETADTSSKARWSVKDIRYHHDGAADSVSLESLLQQSYHSATQAFEKLLLAYHYPNYPSSRQLAKRLGLSHTAIANKLREHKIRGKD